MKAGLTQSHVASQPVACLPLAAAAKDADVPVMGNEPFRAKPPLLDPPPPSAYGSAGGQNTTSVVLEPVAVSTTPSVTVALVPLVPFVPLAPGVPGDPCGPAGPAGPWR